MAKGWLIECRFIDAPAPCRPPRPGLRCHGLAGADRAVPARMNTRATPWNPRRSLPSLGPGRRRFLVIAAHRWRPSRTTKGVTSAPVGHRPRGSTVARFLGPDPPPRKTSRPGARQRRPRLSAACGALVWEQGRTAPAHPPGRGVPHGRVEPGQRGRDAVAARWRPHLKIPGRTDPAGTPGHRHASSGNLQVGLPTWASSSGVELRSRLRRPRPPNRLICRPMAPLNLPCGRSPNPRPGRIRLQPSGRSSSPRPGPAVSWSFF